MLNRICLFVASILACASASLAQVENFNPQTGGVTFVGSIGGVVNPDRFILTNGQAQEASAVWITGKRDLARGFVATVDFQIDGPASNYNGFADGFTLTFQDSSQTALGSAGQGIGCYQNNEFGGPAVQNGFAIEVDMFANVNDGTTVPHMSVQVPYLTGALSGENAQSIVPAFPIPQVGDKCKQILTVSWIDGTLTLSINHRVVYSAPFVWPLATTNVYVGVTSATGGALGAGSMSLYNLQLDRKYAKSDANRDGVVSVDDIFIFLEQYFAGI